MTTAPTPSPDNQLRILRITLELTSPLALGSGDSTGLFDSPCAVDANGLPCLPGTSLAGAIRAWWRKQIQATHPDTDWFGFVPMGEDIAAAQRSRLHISFGHIHRADNQPLDTPVLRSQLLKDSILGPLLGAQMPVREHVRLNARGAAADTAKFDRSHVPAGQRFTFQVQLRLRPDSAPAWESARTALLLAFRHGDIMLGGATRSGLGRVTLHDARELLLKLPADVEKISAHQSLTSRFNAPSLAHQLPPRQPATRPDDLAPLDIQLELAALDLWRVGSSGAEALRMADGRQPDAQPYSEHFVRWDGNQAKLETRKVVPGAGIKGALAHRATFHFNRRSARWATQEGERAPLATLTNLFGAALDDGTGRAGCVHVSDAILSPTHPHRLEHQPHVRLDRFTGGAWNGALFSESLLSKGVITLHMRIQPQRVLTQPHHINGAEWLALADALADLGEGRLHLGAGVARGLGRFRFVNAKQAHAALQQIQAMGHALAGPPAATHHRATSPAEASTHV